MEKKRKTMCLVVIAGTFVLLAIGSTACLAKQTLAPIESTQVETTVPTTEVIETFENGDEIGLTTDEETVYAFDKYGELGKSAFDNLAGAWVKGYITDETALREIMDVTYGDLPTKEELTQEILAMERDAQTNTTPTETKAETPAPQESKPATQPTKPVNTTPTKPANESNNNNSTPTTVSQEQNAPAPTSSTWTAEDEARMQARLKEWDTNKPEEENRGVDIGQDQDFDSAGQWDWD